MKNRGLRLGDEGGLLLLFFPFTVGFFAYRMFGQGLGLALASWFIPALICLLLSGASAYGLLIVPAAFLFFGGFAAERLYGLNLQKVISGEERMTVLALLPWFLGIFVAAHLALDNSQRLLSTASRNPGQKMRRCLLTNFLQSLILGAAAVSAHLIQMI